MSVKSRPIDGVELISGPEVKGPDQGTERKEKVRKQSVMVNLKIGASQNIKINRVKAAEKDDIRKTIRKKLLILRAQPRNSGSKKEVEVNDAK